MSTETQYQDIAETAEMLALISAEKLLFIMEKTAMVDTPVPVRFSLKSFVGPDQIRISDEVQVSYGNIFHYYETDAWGNLQFSTKDDVLSRLTAHKVEQVGK